MFEFFSCFTPSDWIELFGVVFSSLTAFIAIYISIKTLKQNNKMIEESTRPYISIYGQTIVTGERPSFYIVVRNSGNSPAIISKLSYDFDFTECYGIKHNSRDFLKSLIDCPILNGQSKICNLEFDKVNRPVTFNIDYMTYDGKTYHESYTVDLKGGTGLLKGKSKSNDNLLNISYTLQEFVQRNL